MEHDDIFDLYNDDILRSQARAARRKAEQDELERRLASGQYMPPDVPASSREPTDEERQKGISYVGSGMLTRELEVFEDENYQKQRA